MTVFDDVPAGGAASPRTKAVPLPAVSLAWRDTACHLYPHRNGEELLILTLPGDGTFSIGWTSLTAADNLRSRGWEPTDAPVDPRLAEIVARELRKAREAPSAFLASVAAEMAALR